MDLKPTFMKSLREIEDTQVAVLLSGGVDSLSLLFGLWELKKEPIVYTFTLEGRESTDFQCSKTICEQFGIPFHPIYLPTDIEGLKRDILTLILEQGNRKKTDIECLWAFNYAIRQVEERTIVSGMGADGYFGLSKRAMIHYRHSIKSMDEFRLNYQLKRTQHEKVQAFCQSLNKVYVAPYEANAEMLEAFQGTSWEEINRPHQKQPILDMFPEQYEKVKIRLHQNFQKGDSGIAEHFVQLVHSDWNLRHHKSPVGIYNDIIKGLLPIHG